MSANLVPVLWSVWGFVAVVTATLYVYRSSLTKDEEGQIFLDEAFDHEKAVQTEIVRKVSRVEPAVRMSMIATAVMTLLVIVYYSWYAVSQLFG
jgi:hypothetical protein